MTVARQIIPGSIYLVTRRCSERRYFLKPTRSVTHHVSYLLAEACERHDVRLLGAIQMSNHLHLVVHDVHGRLPAFMQRLHSLIARSVNVLHGRDEGFWDIRQAGVTELCDPDAVLDTLAYVACNPVTARLVRNGRDWRGLRTAPGACAAPPVRITRPQGLFSDDGSMPASVEMKVYVPPTHAHLSPGAFAQLLGARVRERERAVHEAAARDGLGFGKPSSAERVRWWEAPAKTEDKRGIRPRVIARSTSQRVAVLSRIALFEAAYATSLARFRRGRRAETFPGGTWRMPVVLGTKVARPPPPAWQC